MIRLDKYISERENLSRSDIKKLVKKKLVSIDGKIAECSEQKLDEKTASVCIDGKTVRKSPFLYLMLNKPKNFLSATTDKFEKTVIELVPKELRVKNLSPVGRLDKDSTGFLLLTNDGNFIHNITSPKSQVEKIYSVRLKNSFKKDYTERIKNISAYKVKTLVQTGEYECDIILTEGKYHEVREIFYLLQNEVEDLHRISIGGVFLDKALEKGEFRELTEDELFILKKSVDKLNVKDII